MLQQTQVDRVIPRFLAFCAAFPTLPALAASPQSVVLTHWIGLGYNRRARYLHQAAKQIMTLYHAEVPRDPTILRTLPGIGPYAAASVAAFAYDAPTLVIDTNIRAVYLYHFFPDRDKVADTELIPYISATLDSDHPRAWYSALMDYGTILKKEQGNHARRSKSYARQSPLKGSVRELRGAILRFLARKSVKRRELEKYVQENYPHNAHNVEKILTTLCTEDFITEVGGLLQLK
jgi:A/G-specific adenine glycosylase